MRETILLLMLICRQVTHTSPEQEMTYYCEIHTQSTIDGRNQSVTIKLWQKSPTVFRVERTRGTATEIAITNGWDRWIFSRAKKQGVHTRCTPQLFERMSKMKRVAGEDVEAFVRMGGRKSGQESVDGAVCDVYRLRRTGLDYGLWVKPGQDALTMRKQVSGKVSGRGKGPDHTLIQTTTFRNWKVGKPIPDSLFRPPPGLMINDSSQRADVNPLSKP